jgi:uncharacterized protein (TIGR03435 family)
MHKLVIGRRKLARKSMFSAAGWMSLAALTFFCWATQTGTAQTTRDLTGTWQGTMQMGKGLRIVLVIFKSGHGGDEGGSWKGVYYSIDQEEHGRLIPSITAQGADFSFAIASIDGRYEGKMEPDGRSITGGWTQGKASYALNLVRATAETEWPIPEPAANMAPDADPAYEVVTIKPSDPTDGERGFQTRGRRVRAVNETMNDLISFSYGIHIRQIAGGPPWFASDRFFIEGVPDAAGQPNLKQFRSMMQKLLADRFNLKFHYEQRELSVYALTVGKAGPKMTRSLGNPEGPPDDEFSRSAWMKETNTTMAEFTKALQYVLDRPVVDHTGLTGRWDFRVQWTPDESQFGGMVPSSSGNPNAAPGLFTAIQEQVGLKLELVKAPADVLVIDHVEKPSAN